LEVVDGPGLEPGAPGDDLGLEAVGLDVDAGGEHQAAGGDRAALVGLAAVVEGLVLGGFAALLPALGEHGVDEDLEALCRAAGVLELAGDQRPGLLPAGGGVEAVEGVAADVGLGRLAGGLPAAGGQHGGLVALVDQRLAVGALVGGGLGPAALPDEPAVRREAALGEFAREDELLIAAAVRAGHEIAAVVGALDGFVDARRAGQARRGDLEHLAV